MKVPLQYKESVEICHDVVCFLFPSLSVEIQTAPTDIRDQKLNNAGPVMYVECTINTNGNQCLIIIII